MNIYGIISLILSIIAFFIMGNPAYIYICLILTVIGLIAGILGIRKNPQKKGIAVAGVIASVVVLLTAGLQLTMGILSYRDKSDLSETRNEQLQAETNREKEENGLDKVSVDTILYNENDIEIKVIQVGGDFISVAVTNHTEKELTVERTDVIINGEHVELTDFQSAIAKPDAFVNMQLLLDGLGIDQFESIKVSYKISEDGKEIVNIKDLTILE
jgi:hypothetical protein